MLDVEIIIKGHISNQWSEWFDNLALSYPFEDQTSLTGQVEDQSALHGLLSRLWELGLPLIAVSTGLKKLAEPVTYLNVRAIIERETPQGIEIILQVRDKPHEKKKWLELPGGRVEPFEPLAEALRREVREETGLELTFIEGLDQRIEAVNVLARVECLPLFAAYQTLHGPVDSLGVYFRCRARGELLEQGDATEEIRWVPVAQIAEEFREEKCGSEMRFSWVDRAGLLFYLANPGRSA